MNTKNMPYRISTKICPITNYIEDLDALIRRTRAKLKKVSALEPKENEIRCSLTPEFEAMANKTA